MALRSVPGVRLGGPGEESAAALQGAPAAHRRARSRPAPPQATALPRSAPRTGEVLGDVQTVPTEAPRADVQARRTEVARRRSRTAPGSRRSSKRRLVLDSSLRARAYGYTKHVIRISEFGVRIVYLRRGAGDFVKLVDLPPIRE